MHQRRLPGCRQEVVYTCNQHASRETAGLSVHTSALKRVSAWVSSEHSSDRISLQRHRCFFHQIFLTFFTHHQTITVVKSFLKVKDLIMNINVRLNFSIKERWETNVCRLSVIVRKKENRNWTKSDSAGRASYFERNPESDAVICGCLGNVLRCGERMLHKKHISNLFGFVLFCLGVAEQASGGLDQHVPGGYALPC